jgi:hypothetical protein
MISESTALHKVQNSLDSAREMYLYIPYYSENNL